MTAAMNANSKTYYGSATTSSGSTAIAAAKLPDFDKADWVCFMNISSSDYIAFKTGPSTVTVAFPASDDTAAEMTIVPPGKEFSVRKEKGHTNFAADSLTGTAAYIVQYGNGP